MKTLFVNLPNKNKVIRRYMCSYNAPNMLYPPLELMYLSSIVKENYPEDQTLMIDAIAENLSVEDLLSQVNGFSPNNIVFMPGFEIFSEDMNIISKIKTKSIIICFGHLPTIFPKEILEKTNVDIILLNEPEISFLRLYSKIRENKSYNGVNGIAYKSNNKIFINSQKKRLSNLDSLPFSDYNSLNNKLAYQEPFLKKPFTIVQTTRGCPHSCNYCVHTYGRQTFFRSAENVLNELTYLVKKQKVKSVKFIDDTFTIDKKRVQDICIGIIERKLKIKWSCLSRADALDLETLKLMKKAGCKRISLGIESGNQRILDLYNKGYKIEDIREKLKLLKKVGIESMGFFMIGAPNETEEEIKESIDLAIKSKLDYVVVGKLNPYPGTLLFDKFKDNIEFNLFPYNCNFKDISKDYFKYEKLFYKSFYFRPRYIFKKINTLLCHPITTFRNTFGLVRYAIYSEREQIRKDFL